jgi:hypothetical protein
MTKERAYALLCGVVGIGMLLGGFALFLGFFRYHLPGSELPGPFTLGPYGIYFVAFTGSALVAWGGALLGAARRPAFARSLGTATALGLVLSGVFRIFVWLFGDYAVLGELPRIEAAIFLLVALAFVWLRPPHPGAQTREVN